MTKFTRKDHVMFMGIGPIMAILNPNHRTDEENRTAVHVCWFTFDGIKQLDYFWEDDLDFAVSIDATKQGEVNDNI